MFVNRRLYHQTFSVCVRPLALSIVLGALPHLGWCRGHQIQTLNTDAGQSMVFSPPYLKVDRGDTIHFVPTHEGHATRTLYTPVGAKGWVGETSKELRVTLTHEGIYIYECMNHGVMGMVGVIQVGKPVNLEEAKKFAAQHIKDKVAMHQQRLMIYLEKVSP